MYVDVVAVLVAGSAAGALVSGVLAVGAWRNRSVPGAVPFGWLMTAAVGWCLLNVVWLTTGSRAVATSVFLSMQVTAGAIVGLWVVFALVYTGRSAWLTPARLAVVVAIPAGYALLSLTNPIHGLTTANVVAVTRNGLRLFVGQTGSLYTVQTVLSAGFVAAGYVLFGEFLLRSRNLYRKQTFVILTAGLLTAGAHGLFVLGATPHPGLDVTPLTFALNGLIIGVALFRYDFVSVTPLAGDLLVDELPDPVLALSDDNRIIDYNTAAASLVGTDDLGGRAIDEVAPDVLADIERDEMFAVGDPLSYYDPQTSAITDQHGAVRGRLVVLREVTGQQRRQEQIEALQAATRQFIEADQPEHVCDLAVRFAARMLDQDAAIFLATDDGRLEAAAVSDTIEESTVTAELSIDPEETPDNELWRTYDSGEQRVAGCAECIEPMETALMMPMGDHGVLVVATDDDSYVTEDKQYARILAHTTQVALEQLVRQRELRGSRTSIQRRNEQIEFFNGVLRHSLRNAMLVVKGRADHLRTNLPPDEHHHIDSITEWCERLNEMSDAIKDINETVTASESERLEAISLSTAVHSAVDSAVDDRTTVELDLDDEQVLANHLAEEVLDSVVENAVEHNTSDEPRVEITTQHAGDWIQVRIADNGPGISDELKTTMFERSISNDQTAGGFGLYFVSVMMDLYGGKVWYEDNDPEGAVAILEFQRAEVATDSGPDVATVGPGDGNAS